MKSLKINNKEFFVYKDDLPDNLSLGKQIAIDTETTGLSMVRDRLCLIQISSGDGNCHLVQFDVNYFKDNKKPENLIKLLTNSEVEKIFHFARFDLAIIKRFLKVSCKKVFCTKIASKLVRTYTDKHGLKDLCKELLEVELNKSQQSSDWSNDELTNNQIKYAASDVLYLCQLREKLFKMLKREDRLDLAIKIFAFLDTRIDLDIMGWDQHDIFAHS